MRCNDDELALAAAASAAADAGRSALVNPEAAAAAAERLREKVCRKASGDKFVCKEKTLEGWIGVPYIVRGAEQRLASYALLAPRADLARAADPGRFCLSKRFGGAARAAKLPQAERRRQLGGAHGALPGVRDGRGRGGGAAVGVGGGPKRGGGCLRGGLVLRGEPAADGCGGGACGDGG